MHGFLIIVFTNFQIFWNKILQIFPTFMNNPSLFTEKTED